MTTRPGDADPRAGAAEFPRLADVVVVGSANLDLVLAVPALPGPGETVLAADRANHAGGKGLNQAVAAARAGASTAFVGAIGDDGPGAMLRAVLSKAAVDTERLRVVDEPTGLAVVVVDEDGENSIVVASGANAGLQELGDADTDMIRRAGVLVLQLEVPLETVHAAAEVAHRAGVQVLLNAAPARQLPPELLALVDVLVVNEHEARVLAPVGDVSARRAPDVESMATALLDLVPCVVVTVGGDGSLVAQRGQQAVRVHAPRVRVVDTTGAGDAFTGALATALACGEPLADAVWFGSCAGSLAVEARGAVPSIPMLAAIRERQRVTSRRDGWPDPRAPRPIDLPTAVPLEPGADLTALDEAKIFAAPTHRSDWPAWREQLSAWRSSARERCAYDDARYADPSNAWAARCWNVAMVWLWDEVIYDWERGCFDLDRLVAAYEPFGGLDAVVLWHAYPVIGIDPRNQFDYYRDVPDLDALVKGLQRRGIRVFLDYNPWDVGTRRPVGSDVDELASLVSGTGADGVFLDTLKQGDSTLRDRLLALDPAPALEGESRVPTERIGDHLLSWAQWMADSAVPGVLRARWYEQRHMLHHTRRWNTDHTDELHSAWVNGAGVLIWDVVFGSYVGWSARDQSIMRAMRRVHLGLGDHLLYGQWTPLADELTEQATDHGVFGSAYSHEGVTLWTLVNRSTDPYAGPVLTAPTEAGGEWFDVVAGAVLRADGGADARAVHVTIPARAVGGVLRVPAGAARPDGLTDLLKAAAADGHATDDTVTAPPTARVPAAGAYGPPSTGAVVVPGGGRDVPYRFRVRETGLRAPAYRPGTWKPLPPHLHGIGSGARTVELASVAVDPVEVTNAEFAAFLADSRYQPLVANRFLGHWVDGRPAPGSDDNPVTFVDLDDARAYAAWRGARLPTDAEWQLAAADPGWRRAEPLVWNWTESKHRDGRTRWAFPKGGSRFAAAGSDWYVDGGPQEADWALRLLLLGGGLARSECIGFRCAVDLEPVAPASEHRSEANGRAEHGVPR